MSAGIPGLGLSGLFFIISALLAPAIELLRTARGRSTGDAWSRVGRQFAIAAAMIISLAVSLHGVLLMISLTGADGPLDRGLSPLPLPLIGVTGALLATVLAGAKALELCLRFHERGLPRIRFPSAGSLRYRIVRGTAFISTAWLALLLFGVAELNPVSADRGLGAPEYAAAEKPSEAEGRIPTPDAKPGARLVPATPSDEAGSRPGTAAKTAAAPSGEIVGTAFDRSSEFSDESGRVTAGDTRVPDSESSPAKGSAVPPEPPFTRADPEPGPFAQAGNPPHARPPVHANMGGRRIAEQTDSTGGVG